MSKSGEFDGGAEALLILTSSIKEDADPTVFNKWYNEVHVPDLLTIPEFQSCRRYRVTAARLFPGQVQEPDYDYAAVYRIKAGDDAALIAAARKVEELGMSGISESDAFDYSRVTASYLLPISDEIVMNPDYKVSRKDG